MLKASLIAVTGISAIGLPAIFSYSLGEVEKTPIPKLVLSSQKENGGAQLSWEYSSFVQNGTLKENISIPFEKSNMKFGDYKLKKGDILCSPAQDGTYLLLRLKDGKRYEYEIEGSDKIWRTCPVRGFLKSNPNVKTIKLNGFQIGRNLYSSTIFISSCSFALNKAIKDLRWNITWDKCKSSEFNGTNFSKITMSIDN